MYIRQSFTQALGSGALNTSISITKDCRVAAVYINFSSSATENVYLELDAIEGSSYDCLFRTISVSSATDAAYAPEGERGYILTKGDSLKITSTNNAAVNLYGVVLLELLD